MQNKSTVHHWVSRYRQSIAGFFWGGGRPSIRLGRRAQRCIGRKTISPCLFAPRHDFYTSSKFPSRPASYTSNRPKKNPNHTPTFIKKKLFAPFQTPKYQQKFLNSPSTRIIKHNYLFKLSTPNSLPTPPPSTPQINSPIQKPQPPTHLSRHHPHSHLTQNPHHPPPPPRPPPQS